MSDLAELRGDMGLGETIGALPVANGGTGATTVEQARENLGLESYVKELVTELNLEIISTFAYLDGTYTSFSGNQYREVDIETIGSNNGFTFHNDGSVSDVYTSFKVNTSGVYEASATTTSNSSNRDVVLGEFYSISSPLPDLDGYVSILDTTARFNLSSSEKYGFYAMGGDYQDDISITIQRIA